MTGGMSPIIRGYTERPCGEQAISLWRSEGMRYVDAQNLADIVDMFRTTTS